MKTEIENTLKPKVGSVYGHAWSIMKKYFLPLFLILLIVGVANMPTSFINDNSNRAGHKVEFKNMEECNFEAFIESASENHEPLSPGMILLKIFGLAYLLFVVNPINYGAAFLRLKAVRQQKFEVKEIFDVFKNYLNVILAALLSMSIIVIGFIFLIVPGIVFACRLAFVPYLVMDKKLDPVKAVEESWRLTKGYGWRIFGMGLLTIPIFIAGLLLLIVGLIPAFIWITAAFASMYHAVMLERGEAELEVV